MRLDDHLQLGLANLWRTKLRTVLTTLGVTIGIGALVSMVSFGTGMQKNVTEAFRENDLFTSLYVTQHRVDMEHAMEGDIEGVMESFQEEVPPLNDEVLGNIQAFPGVEIAFPEIRFPAKVRLGNEEIRTTIRALPSVMGRYKPFDQLPFGQFFTVDTTSSAVISPRVLKELKIILKDPSRPTKISLEDSARGIRSLLPDSILGQEIEIITSVVDVTGLIRNPLRQLNPSTKTPFREEITRFKISGIQKESDGFIGNRFMSGIIVPMKAAERIPRLGFSSMWDLLGRMGKSDGYSSIYVRAKKIEELEPIKEKIEAMGFGIFSIADQLEEIKKGFIVLDTALGSIGAIALVVAALGIINTMVMSILERTREIGIMKAIGGSENEIKGIFFIEAGSIGLFGGIFGLALGWIVTRIANVVVNYYIARQGGPHVDLFYIPPWLILGALAFSILVSLLAGLYPAVRAARVDPVEALRHD